MLLVLLYLVTHDDLGAVQDLDMGEFHRVVSDLHHRLSDSSMLLWSTVGMMLLEVAGLDSGGPHGASQKVASS